MKGVILGIIVATGVSVLDNRTDKIVTNALVGGAAGYFLLMLLNKNMK